MRNIYITEEQYEKFFKNKKDIITEALSEKVYHFTSMWALSQILKDDRFVLSTSFKGVSDDYGGKNKFFLFHLQDRGMANWVILLGLTLEYVLMVIS